MHTAKTAPSYLISVIDDCAALGDTAGLRARAQRAHAKWHAAFARCDLRRASLWGAVANAYAASADAVRSRLDGGIAIAMAHEDRAAEYLTRLAMVRS